MATDAALSEALVRSVAVLAPTLVLLFIFALRPPTTRLAGAALLATLWNLSALTAVNVAAIAIGWWSFPVEGPMLFGVPLDLLLGWSVFWGAIPVLLARRVPLTALTLAALLIDVAWMPAIDSVLVLSDSWLWGEAVLLLLAFVPAQLLGRLTANRSMLNVRVALQMLLFFGLSFYLIPGLVLQLAGRSWRDAAVGLSTTEVGLWIQVMAVPGVIALTAVDEFRRRGYGTPFPWDPPARLVRSGPYAYLANPMQASMTFMMVLMGLAIAEWRLLAAGFLAAVFSAGLAGWNERSHLNRRFGTEWHGYRCFVSDWLPRWAPSPDRSAARLYVAVTCDPCSAVGTWFSRQTVALDVVPAESHAEPLTRVRYESDDGAVVASGIVAIAYALEHRNLAYAWLGWLLRLPVVRTAAQVLIDAVGGGERELSRSN